MYASYTCRTPLPIAYPVIRSWKGTHCVFLYLLTEEIIKNNGLCLCLSRYYLEDSLSFMYRFINYFENSHLISVVCFDISIVIF